MKKGLVIQHTFKCIKDLILGLMSVVLRITGVVQDEMIHRTIDIVQ